MIRAQGVKFYVRLISTHRQKLKESGLCYDYSITLHLQNCFKHWMIIYFFQFLQTGARFCVWVLFTRLQDRQSFWSAGEWRIKKTELQNFILFAEEFWSSRDEQHKRQVSLRLCFSLSKSLFSNFASKGFCLSIALQLRWDLRLCFSLSKSLFTKDFFLA